MNICIVGLGYVGTVSAACLATRGHCVWGVDINAEKVRLINSGRSPVVEPGLDDKVQQATCAGRLRASCDIQEGLWKSDLCFVTVATPSRKNGDVDPTHLFRACEQIAVAVSVLGRRQVVVIRSSVLPSIFDRCREIFALAAPNLVELGSNPEFLREGSAIRDFDGPPFTVIGTSSIQVEESLRLLYSDLPVPLYVIPAGEALMLKYACNAYHALKVSFANEIGTICQQSGIDAHVVMSVFCKDTALNIAPNYLMPGFAFGGSCLPKDLRALVHAARHDDIDVPLISAILPSNEKMIDRAFEKIRKTDARRVALIGLSFKSHTDDLRESPFVELAERLLGKGYELGIYDPNLSLARLTGTNKDYIDSVIPHLSRLLVSSLDDLNDVELLIIAHHFTGVEGLLRRTETAFIDLQGHLADRIGHRPHVAERVLPHSTSVLPLPESLVVPRIARGTGFDD